MTIWGRRSCRSGLRAACPSSTSSATDSLSANACRAWLSSSSVRSRAGQKLVGVGLAHRPHQVRRRCGHPGSVPERAGRQREGQRHLTGGDGKRLGQQMWQMGDAAAAASCSSDLGRHHDGAAVQRQVHHLRPHRRVDVVVDAEHPGRPDEQPRVARGPARVGGAGHRVTTDERSSRPASRTASQNGAFDADDVGQRAVGRDVADVAQQRAAARAPGRPARSARCGPRPTSAPRRGRSSRRTRRSGRPGHPSTERL